MESTTDDSKQKPPIVTSKYVSPAWITKLDAEDTYGRLHALFVMHGERVTYVFLNAVRSEFDSVDPTAAWKRTRQLCLWFENQLLVRKGATGFFSLRQLEGVTKTNTAVHLMDENKGFKFFADLCVPKRLTDAPQLDEAQCLVDTYLRWTQMSTDKKKIWGSGEGELRPIDWGCTDPEQLEAEAQRKQAKRANRQVGLSVDGAGGN